MRIPIEDDYNNSSTKIIIEQCEKEMVSANYSGVNEDVTIIEAVYNEATNLDDSYVGNYIEYYESGPKEEYQKINSINGKIVVTSRLANLTGSLISSAKINLYMLNGLTPKLVETKESDDGGVVVFDNLNAGSYRVIAIVDRKFFEKPTYFDWNEVTLDNDMKEAKITVVNKIKNSFKK